MRIARVARTTAVFIAGICILSASASAGALTPAAKMSGADTVYGSTRGGGPRTCSAFAHVCKPDWRFTQVRVGSCRLHANRRL